MLDPYHPGMRLMLMRHAQTHGNVAGALDTAVPGLDLTELGHRQAHAASKALLEPAGFDGIYVSPLVRTQQTAAPVSAATGLAPNVLPGLREISAGQLEMATDEESTLAYALTVGSWIEGKLDTRMPGGESGHEFIARYDEAIAAIAAAEHDRALAVSHGAAIRCWVAIRVNESDQHPGARLGFENTAGIELVGDPDDGWRVHAWSPEAVGRDHLS